LKCSKQSDKNQDDPVWRIRALLEIFRKNIKTFQFFETAVSVDEMMVKFYGRLMIKQFIRNKPVRFGIKMWAVCGADGYLFDCDIYCGKNMMKNGKLSQIFLGSRVVLNILEDLLLKTTKKKLGMYHLYCDNFFTSPDLFIHLQQIGLKATGVVRKDRIKEENSIDKKSTRGTYAVKHDKTSGLNFITLMDSKEVLVLSIAAGVQPIKKAKRYSKEMKEKIDIGMPSAFSLYNKYMGGVDLHNQYCSKVAPSIKSRKWTWPILMRLIQSSLSNGLILRNAVCKDKKKMTSKEFSMSIANEYLKQANLGDLKTHNQIKTTKRNICSNDKCSVRNVQSFLALPKL